MTLARDASSPAVKLSAFLGTQTASLASNSFSPPAGSIIRVTCWAGDSFQNDWDTNKPTISNSGTALTWNLISSQFNNGLTNKSIRTTSWWAFTATAPGSMTVTVAEGTQAGQTLTFMAVAVTVLTGANTTNPIGATAFSNATTGGTRTVAITPTQLGSALFMEAGNWNDATTVPLTAGTGCFLLDDANQTVCALAAGGIWLGTDASTPTLTTSLSSVNLIMTDSVSTLAWSVVAYEVLPAPVVASSFWRQLGPVMLAPLSKRFGPGAPFALPWMIPSPPQIPIPITQSSQTPSPLPPRMFPPLSRKFGPAAPFALPLLQPSPPVIPVPVTQSSLVPSPIPPRMFPPLSRQFGPAAPFAQRTTSPSNSANVNGVAALINVAGGIGTVEGDANVTGVAALINVAGGIGSPDGGTNNVQSSFKLPPVMFQPLSKRFGPGAPFTQRLTSSTLSSDVPGVAAQITVAGGVGTVEGDANVTGVGALINVAGGIGTPAGSANVTGVAALINVDGGIGVATGSANNTQSSLVIPPYRFPPLSRQFGPGAPFVQRTTSSLSASVNANVAGIGAAINVDGGIGTSSGSANVTGVGAAINVAGGVGTTSGSANVAGVGALINTAGGIGTLAAAANIAGVAALINVLGGIGVAHATGTQIPGFVDVSNQQVASVAIAQSASTVTITNKAVAGVGVVDTAASVSITNKQVAGVSIGELI